ncbi:MAG: hypothetical protein ABI663_16625 [Chryseolinea sp.]
MKFRIPTLYTALLFCATLLLTSCSGRMNMKRLLPAENPEVIPDSPSPRYAWVTGRLKYSKSGYQWQSGNYHQIPNEKKSYVEGRYVMRLGRHKYAHSHWQ